MSADRSVLRRVGYWWSEKKSRKLNMNLLTQIFRSAGLELVKVDLKKSLEEQGPFAAIVHKSSGIVAKAHMGDSQSESFLKAFEEYEINHPEVVIIDPLQKSKHLLDRSCEYELVKQSQLQREGIALVPAFVTLTSNNTFENLAKMKAAGVTFPCVCKPSVTHGSIAAHLMCLIFNEDGLKDITPPCVVQKFVNHNAVLYKLFIIADKYFVIERPSLKNFTAGDQETIFFNGNDVSKPHSSSALNELDETEPKSPIIHPEKDKLDHIVNVLCKSTELSLFGVDLIIDNATGQYFIIDMNIFPGYDGVENFFQLLCDLIISRITLHPCRKDINSFTKPDSVDSEKTPVLKSHSLCKKLMPDSISDIITNDIPYSCNCFCCPITGVCGNTFSVVHSTNHTFRLEVTDALQILSSGSVDQDLSFMKDGEHFCSPDSAQDDSGIETSDSCDEKKKKAAVPKAFKRQHSRNYNTQVVVEDNV